MKILLISYGDCEYDGRLRELIRVFSTMGELFAFSRGHNKLAAGHKTCNATSYARFIKDAVAFGKQLRSLDILVLDNRKAVIPGLLLKRAIAPKIIVQDCRELYVPSEVSHLSGKIGCFFEKRGIQKANIIICANQERAQKMQELYSLKRTPLVFENLRQLEYSSEQAFEVQEKRFTEYIHQDEFRIITTSGCSISRTNDVLVRNLKNVEKPCRLFMVGNSSPVDRHTIEQIVQEEGLHNVEIIGQLDRDALKYLISVSHIGIVNYHQNDYNNRYCASGKLFEFLYEGIPVVTTTNPPLRRFCEEFGVGVADDNYANAINRILKNYGMYRNNVRDYAMHYPIENNNDALRKKMQEEFTKIV